MLFKGYFAKDRYETLDQVVGVAERTAQYLVQKAALPEGDELEALSTKLEIIGESAEAYQRRQRDAGLQPGHAERCGRGH